jgi:putative spermidine/putrescine transport system permease protein
MIEGKQGAEETRRQGDKGTVSSSPMLLLLPALTVVVVLFGGGLAMAVAQSLGYVPSIGRSDVSLDAYRRILSDPAFGRSLGLSLWIAAVSAIVSTILAVGGALALRRPLRGQKFITFIYQLPIPIPHLVGAIGILFLLAQSGLLARLTHNVGLIQVPADFPALVYDRYGVGIILTYVWKSTPFIGIILSAILRGLSDEYGEAARTLGANGWQRFRYVTLPFLMPGIVSASILVFAFTFGAFEVPLLLGQRFPSMLPVLAYRYYIDVDLNRLPEAMAMNVVMAAIIVVLIFVYMRLAAPKD